MYYTDKIINPTESIEQILAAIEKFDKERFLYALQYKNWDEAAIDRMASEVSDYRVRLKEELQRLADFANVFNNEFAIGICRNIFYFVIADCIYMFCIRI